MFIYKGYENRWVLYPAIDGVSLAVDVYCLLKYMRSSQIYRNKHNMSCFKARKCIALRMINFSCLFHCLFVLISLYSLNL